MRIRSTVSADEVARRWPQIERWLGVGTAGWIEDEYLSFWTAVDTLSAAEQAAAHREWAEFYEWRLAQRGEELAGDPGLRKLVAGWTDNMAYQSRRCAALAEGVDPGPWVPSWERRADLCVDQPGISPERNPDHEAAPAGTLRRDG